ncbi:DUF4868 domain-containing protein [Roseovarius sp. EGI FJ00037]|uniref:Kiwa anti-phage protein KwaB-like domain-containing protein n=1 Tax=Roseovarius salincola TaxID=2978479 RepID=UPI0022A8CA49|nr:Kiwa anti-phage protein KwaB-like domain-containing protein [Roseovarius sp. EGI FJ00037]MCZ0814062.1 DUF4868 domain-containing protein [Roseovarius sp. EGI FJ00037]
MIEDDFDFQNIHNVNFAVALRGNGNRYFVPTDAPIKEALKEVLGATLAGFAQLGGDWEPHDISEDYGDRRRVYGARDTDYLADLSAIFDSGDLDDLANAHDHVPDIDHYFGIFHDNQGRKAVGIKKGTQLKGTLGARNKLMRLAGDDTLKMIEDDVLKLDREFDAIVTDGHVFMLKVRSVEYLANIVEHVAGAAAHKVQQIHDTIDFLDFTRIQADIARHPRMARMAASIAARNDLAQIRQDRIQELAAHHGLVLNNVDGRLRCRRQDETKLLEILDDRRYQVDLTATGPVPYRATGRQKVTT